MSSDERNEETRYFSGDSVTFPSGSVQESIPKQIGRYQIERILGKGGFGIVYLAADKQ